MNYVLLAALATTMVGILPLIVKRRLYAAAVIGGVGFFALWFIFWAGKPSTVYPFWGPVGFFVLVLWAISAFIDGRYTRRNRWGDTSWGPTHLMWIPAIGGMIWLGSFFVGWSALNAQTYASMIGPVEEQVWTQNVQPKDPRHMNMISYATAEYLAKKAVAQGGSIGSQFNLDTDLVRLQRVHGELAYVFPFDFRGFTTWWSSDAVPAFIVVYAEDPERTPRLVNLSRDKHMRYTPAAYWNSNLERHMRNNGFLNDGLDDYHLELDEEENPYWVVTTYQPTVTWFGDKVTGVATVNPTTGEIKRYTIETAPAWIDRIFPRDLVKSYLEWHGELSGGWLNSWWTKLNLTEPEKPTLIYGEGNRAEFVVGMTSKNGNNDSLIGLMYVDSRTGKPLYYQVNGGATDRAIIAAVNANDKVRYRHLTATTPQIYNVYGNMAAVVPLMNDTGAFQGVAIVSVLNVQDVAVGATQSEALRNYQTLASRHGQQIALEKTMDVTTLSGIIDRIRQDVGQNGSVYYFHIEGAPRIFVGSSQDYSKLPLTERGDSVTIKYVASGEEVVSVRSFDNISLPLDKSEMQDEVERAAKARADAEARRKKQ
ncbi:hypothetical protein HYT05_04240 [Candidatus Kaiserbacteria bacterium]|nr:hypothetical protein [Candidatus Kaiserbacteria bacterium]